MLYFAHKLMFQGKGNRVYYSEELSLWATVEDPTTEPRVMEGWLLRVC